MNDSEYWRFISDNTNADATALHLAYASRKHKLEFDFDDAVLQIEARRKSSRKIPWFIAHDRFRFPSIQASEQASNQVVSLYHASKVGTGKRIADLTTGLGIDAMTISLRGNKVDAFELDKHRTDVLINNANLLGLRDFHVHADDSIAYLRSNPGLCYDWLFIDPARRDADGRRIFKLQDSLPNVIANMDLLFRSAPDILIKASPLLDISQTERDLKRFPRHSVIGIVSYRGEVKEVLLHLSTKFDKDLIEVVDIASAPEFPEGQPVINYRFMTDGGNDSPIRLAETDDVTDGNYLYEAGAGMRKLRCAPLICRSYPDMKALTTDAELFVSHTLHRDFPGRINTIRRVISAKEAGNFHGQSLRVVSSRYPVTADEIRKKYGLRQGDAVSLVATSLNKNKKMLILVDSI